MSRRVTRHSRGSILKPQKPSETENVPENQLQTPGDPKARRVSFAASNFVKPFSDDPEQVTAWDETYEEEMRQTDSSKGTTASSLTLTVTEDTLEINLTKTTTQRMVVPKILDKENLRPVEVVKKMKSKGKVKKNEDFSLKIFGDSSDEDCSPFLSDKVEIQEFNPGNKEEIRIFEDSGEDLEGKNGKIAIFEESVVQEKKQKDKTTIFDDSLGNMEITGSLPTVPILPINKEENGIKTMIFEDSQANMDFTSAESNRRKTIVFDESQADLEMTLNLPTFPILTINKEDKELKIFEDSFVETNKRKTIVFNESQADIEMTANLPTLPILAVNNEDNQMKIFEDSQENNRRKTIVFNESQADIEITASLPTLPVNNEDNKLKIFEDSQANIVENDRGKTIVFNESQADIEMTAKLPTFSILTINNEDQKMKIFEDSEENNRRKTIVFNESQADIEMTANLPTLPILPVNNEDNQLKIFEDSQENNRRKTIVFDESQADIEMTANLPTLPILPVNNEDNEMKIFEDSQENNRRKTIVFNESQADIEMTANLPTLPILPVNNEDKEMKIFEDSQESNRRKTIVFNESQADIEMTAKLPTFSILTINNEANKMNIFGDSQTNIVENNRRKTIFFDESQADIEMTANFPPLPILPDNKTLPINSEKSPEKTEENISLTTNTPERNERRKTMFNNITRLTDTSMIVDSQFSSPETQGRFLNKSHDYTKIRILQNITLDNFVPIVKENRKVIDIIREKNSSISSESNSDKQNTYVINKNTDSLISNESFNTIPPFLPGNVKNFEMDSFQYTNISIGSNIEDTEFLINADVSGVSMNESRFSPVKKSIEEEILTYKPMDMGLFQSKLLEKLKPGIETIKRVYDEIKDLDWEEEVEDMDSSSESEEEAVLEVKPKTILEKIQEADERSEFYWTFDHHEASTYFFTTFKRNARFSVDIDSKDYVTNITTSLHIPEDTHPQAKFQLHVFMDKMKKERIEAALGTKYDILGLLEYVYMAVKEIMVTGFKFLTQYQREYGLKVSDDMKVHFRVLNVESIIAWEFEVDMLNIHEPKIVLARSKFGTPMKEEEVRELVVSCPTGLHFIEKYIEKIVDYCQTVRVKLQQSGDI